MFRWLNRWLRNHRNRNVVQTIKAGIKCCPQCDEPLGKDRQWCKKCGWNTHIEDFLNRIKSEKGAVAVEAALIMPVICLAILGGMDLWILSYYKQQCVIMSLAGAEARLQNPDGQGSIDGEHPTDTAVVRQYCLMTTASDPSYFTINSDYCYRDNIKFVTVTVRADVPISGIVVGMPHEVGYTTVLAIKKTGGQ